MKRMMINALTLLIGLALGFFVAARPSRNIPTAESVTTTRTGPTLEAVQALASLVTTKVTVSDVQLTELQGYTGGAKAALLVRGDFTLGTNLAFAHLTDVDPVARSVTIVLAQPSADNPRVDLSRTRLVAVTTEGLWDIVPGHTAEAVVTDDAYREAQQMVLRVSRDSEWQRQSRAQAEHVLETFFTSVDWKVSVQWQGGGQGGFPQPP